MRISDWSADVCSSDLWANSREVLVTLEFNAPLKEILAMFRRHKFSRYPVYDSERQEFVGLLHIKDLLLELAALDHIPESFNLAELTRPLERVSLPMKPAELSAGKKGVRTCRSRLLPVHSK